MSDTSNDTRIPPTPEALAADLVDLLDVEEIDTDLYRGRRSKGGVGRVFGGQVIAQALQAAQQAGVPLLTVLAPSRPPRQRVGTWPVLDPTSWPDRIRRASAATTAPVRGTQRGPARPRGRRPRR